MGAQPAPAAHPLHLIPPSLPPCRAKNQQPNALFRSWNGAVGAEICLKVINGCFLLRKEWASHGDDPMTGNQFLWY
eukprot:1145695-Pelagomonas_calceolata.AAC.6